MLTTIRTIQIFPVSEAISFKEKALSWANQFSHFSYLNPNDFSYLFDPFPHLLAAGTKKVIDFDGKDSFDSLKKYCQLNKEWLFGYFSYDLKNEIEALESHHIDRMDFPKIYFYQPEHLLFFEQGQVRILSDKADEVYHQINNTKNKMNTKTVSAFNIQSKFSKNDYLNKAENIRRHIIEGDVYELNLCMEFFAEKADLDPLPLYLKLNQASPMPFSIVQKTNDQWLISASPERFLKKQGQKLISQPIKGTIQRGKTSQEDQQLKKQLRNDEKELAENMMIVDLVRNDLAKSALAGSVKPQELFGIYTFRQVHQMISTISATLKKEVHFIDAIKNAFPMGSMTGAPKIKAMELIEQYEETMRGLYSGAAGFITPEGDFDFNVVIRSILYNNNSKKLSFQVGSAITYDAVPEKEYEECLLKARAIMEVLNNPVQ